VRITVVNNLFAENRNDISLFFLICRCFFFVAGTSTDMPAVTSTTLPPTSELTSCRIGILFALSYRSDFREKKQEKCRQRGFDRATSRAAGKSATIYVFIITSYAEYMTHYNDYTICAVTHITQA